MCIRDRYFIPRLMYLLSAVMAVIYVVDLLIPGLQLRQLMSLDMARVAQGEIWRLISFVIVPPYDSPVLVLISLYFYCLIGNGLENEWGGFKFNVYYLFGIVGEMCIRDSGQPPLNRVSIRLGDLAQLIQGLHGFNRSQGVDVHLLESLDHLVFIRRQQGQLPVVALEARCV